MAAVIIATKRATFQKKENIASEEKGGDEENSQRAFSQVLHRAFRQNAARQRMPGLCAKADVDEMVSILEKRKRLGSGFVDFLFYVLFAYFALTIVYNASGIREQYQMYAAISSALGSVGTPASSVQSYEDVNSWEDLYSWCVDLRKRLTSTVKYNGIPKTEDEVTNNLFG
jgi:hypothetical protein